MQTASPTGLVVLTEVEPISIVFVLPEDAIPDVWREVRAGKKLTVTAYNRTDNKLIATGALESVDNEIDTTTGTVKLRATFPNTDEALFPNQFVNARLLVRKIAGATIAPVAAIQHGAPGTFVFLIKPDGTVARPEGHDRRHRGRSDPDRIRIEGRGQRGRRRRGSAARRRQGPGLGRSERCSRESERWARRAARPAAGQWEERASCASRHARGGTRFDAARPAPVRPTDPRAPAMNPSRIFIERPVGTTLLMVAMLLVGVVAYRFLPVSALPEVDYPTIQVSTFYPGASPEVMTTAVTAPLERQFGEMPGLAQMSSISSAGAAVTTLQFDLNLSLDVAEQEVQAAINAATGLLPAGLPAPPVYAKINPANAPVLTLAATSKTLPLTQVEDVADVRIAEKISQVSGVGLVSIAGGQRPALRVQVNPRALAAYGLAIDDIRTDLTNQNTDLPKGNFDGPTQNSTINNNDQLQTAADYRNLVVAYKNGGAVRLSDVATVVEGPENTELAAWANKTPAIILNIQRQPGTNVIAVVDAVKAVLPKLQQTLPAGIDLTILSDQTGDDSRFG